MATEVKKYLVITIDVEPDCTPSWHYSSPLTFHGVTQGIGERLQPVFNKHGACPTYLINNVVLEDRESVKTFSKLPGKFELGTHLHSEFIEPERLFSEYAGKKGEANQCFLHPEVEFAKMQNITKLFERNFDRKPTSFRAGRFSAGANTIRSLTELGYKVDTSVTPFISWNDKTRKNAVDYRTAPDQPYFIQEGGYPHANANGHLLEVPVSIINKRKYFFLKKPLWLRPFMSQFEGFIEVINTLERQHAHKPLLVFNMMFHNVEVLPKLSPYPQTEEQCKRYLDSIDQLLTFCQENNIACVGLSDLYEIYGRK